MFRMDSGTVQRPWADASAPFSAPIVSIRAPWGRLRSPYHTEPQRLFAGGVFQNASVESLLRSSGIPTAIQCGQARAASVRCASTAGTGKWRTRFRASGTCRGS